jgi:hypothetical protein
MRIRDRSASLADIAAVFDRTVEAMRLDAPCHHLYRVRQHKDQGPTLVCIFCSRERR